MNFRKISNIKFLLCFSIFLLFPSSLLAFSFSDKRGIIDLPKDPSLTYVNIISIGSAISIGSTFKINSFLIQGVGTVFSDNFVLTAAHVVKPGFINGKPLLKILERQIIITQQINIENLNGMAVPAEIYFLDIKKDIALLNFKNSSEFIPIKYHIEETLTMNTEGYGIMGNIFPSSILMKGDAVAAVVHKRDEYGVLLDGFEVKYGKVISTIPKSEYAVYYNNNQFVTDIPVRKGDSGSIVFAFKIIKTRKKARKIPILVGIVTMGDIKEGLMMLFGQSSSTSYVSRIDIVKKILNAENIRYFKRWKCKCPPKKD